MEKSYLYSLPYIFIFIILLFLYRREKNGIKTSKREGKVFRSKYEFWCFILLLIFLGLRGHLYTDFIAYYDLFENVPTIKNMDGYEYPGIDQGFVIYASLFKTIIPNYYCWVFFNALLDLSVFFWLFRKYTDYTIFAFVVFIAYQGIYIEFNLFRNSKSICLFLLSIPYLIKRKPLPYLILNALGALMHFSSLLLLPLYFVIHKKWPLIFLWSLIGISCVFFLLNVHFSSYVFEYFSGFSVNIIQAKIDKYSAIEESYGFNFGFIERTIITILFLCFYNKLTEKRIENIVFINCAALYFFIFYFFSDVAIFTERISYLFIFAYWVLITEVCHLPQKNSSSIRIAILFICFLRLLTSNTSPMSYYDNQLWGIKNKDERVNVIISNQ